MSNSLVYRSLELLDCDKYLRSDKTKKKKKHKDVKYKGILDLIPTKHRFTSKHDKIDLDTIPGQSSKVTVYEVQKHIAAQQDPLDENIKQLLLLSKNRLNPETANKLLHRAVKKKCITKQEKPKGPEKTAFTEEDFNKFEQEIRNN